MQTVFLSKLLPHLTERGHRVLIFSQFKVCATPPASPNPPPTLLPRNPFTPTR